MELTEVTSRANALEQQTQAERNDVASGTPLKRPDMRNEKIRHGHVKDTPNNVDCRGRESFAGRLCKRALEGTSHNARHKVGDSVLCKNTAEEVRNKPEPIHNVESPFTANESYEKVIERSLFNHSSQQFERIQKLLLLLRRKPLRNGSGEPIVACGLALLYQVPTFLSERHQSLPPIVQIRRTADEAGLLHGYHDFTH
jgi:hypothetical protein